MHTDMHGDATPDAWNTQAAAEQRSVGAAAAPSGWTHAVADESVRVLDLASALVPSADPVAEDRPSASPDSGGNVAVAPGDRTGLRASAAEFVPGAAVPGADAIFRAGAREFVPQAKATASSASRVGSDGTDVAHIASADASMSGPRVGGLADQQFMPHAWGGGCLHAAGAADRPSTLAAQIVQLVLDFLSHPRSKTFSDKEGYVSIGSIVLHHTPLNRKAFGSTQAVLRSVKSHGLRQIRLDRGCRRVRLLTLAERLRAEAALVFAGYPRGAEVPVAELSSSSALQQMLAHIEEAHRLPFLRQCLEDGESRVVLNDAGTHFIRRAHEQQLREAVETLFSDEHLAEDPRLRSKIAQAPGGDIPLSWIHSRYQDYLGFSGPARLDTIEEETAELCQVLGGSEFLCIDAQRLTVRRRSPPKLETNASQDQGGNDATGVDGQPRKRSLRNAGLRLQQLLDFYFEPFNLQHNRLLLDLVAQRAGPPLFAGPWPVEALRDFSFQLEDLTGLGRINAELLRLRISSSSAMPLDRMVGPLKHLRCLADGHLLLLEPPEVRSFVVSGDADPEIASAALRYLSVSCEERGQAPPGLVSVLSLHAREALVDTSPQGEQRRSRLKRQLLLHHTDLICLQGFDADGNGAGLASALAGEGYACASSRAKASDATTKQPESRPSEDQVQEGNGKTPKDSLGEQHNEDEEACAIFWQRSRWQLQTREQRGSAVMVTLSPFEKLGKTLRVVCMRAAVPTMACPDLGGLLGQVPSSDPVVVCTDCTQIGGAEAASVVEEFADLASVMTEVVGKELGCPLIAPDAALSRAGAPPQPVRDGASGLVEVHHPDAVLFQGMVPAVVLSCHTLGYLAKMAPEDMMHQFPALRLPIVVAFDWMQAGRPPLAPKQSSDAGQAPVIAAADDVAHDAASPPWSLPPPPTPTPMPARSAMEAATKRAAEMAAPSAGVEQMTWQ